MIGSAAAWSGAAPSWAAKTAGWARGTRPGLFSIAAVVGVGAGLGAVAFPYLIYFFTLAVAIASIVSRMLSYGTIYTTKLLRRGIDVDRAAPWRAFGDMKVREAMQPLGTPLPVPDGQPGEGEGPGPASLPGPVTHRRDPQILFLTSRWLRRCVSLTSTVTMACPCRHRTASRSWAGSLTPACSAPSPTRSTRLGSRRPKPSSPPSGHAATSPGPELILSAGDRINLLAPRPLKAAAARDAHPVQDPGAPPDEAPGSANLTDR